MKYEQTINTDFNNTMTIFMKEINNNAKVLEFGPASGRLTKYLKEERNCEVYIVEIDDESGNIAKEYAVKALIGNDEGNIESFTWHEKFKDIRFDYILFADVLEHLHNPLEVLKKAKELLKDTGYMLTSIPNVAHNSVILDLLKNKFVYRDTGILDNTHLKFWTYESIEELFKNAGLNVDIRYATYSQVGFNEFGNKYSDCGKNLEFELKARDMAEVYQFVYKVSEKAECRNENAIQTKTDYYYTQWLDEINGEFDVEGRDKEPIIFDSMNQIKNHNLSSGCTRVRFDPINKSNCCIRINKISVVNEIEYEVPYTTNAEYSVGNVHYFSSDDPQVVVDIKEINGDRITINYDYISVLDDKFDTVFNMIGKEQKNFSDIISQKEDFINQQRSTLSDRDNEIRELNGIIEQKENYICEQRDMIESKENERKNMETEKNEEINKLYDIIRQQDEMILHRGHVIRCKTAKGHLKSAAHKIIDRVANKTRSKKRTRIGVLNPYLPTLGGGEKHMGYMCQFIEEYYNYKVDMDIIVFNYNDVNVFSSDYITIDDVNKQFGLNLKKTKLRKLNLNPPSIAIETVEQQRIIEALSSEYDIFINFMFQSKHIGKAKVNIYQCMFPPKRMEPMPVIYPSYREIEKQHDQDFADSYQVFITNSEYTNHWCDTYWQTANKQTIIYPPVFEEKDLVGKYQEDKKKNIIMSVGRFFVGSHSKKQLDLVKFFVNHQDVFKDYEYHLAGAVATYQEDVDYLNEIKALASTVNNVFIHENCPFKELMELYSQAKIFWHATGYGVDENIQPEKMEHFGITPVEAMSYGVIPVVINKGGPKETVIDGEIGYCWNTEEECVAKTKLLIDDDELRRDMAVKATERAKEYSIEKFYERHRKVFNELQI